MTYTVPAGKWKDQTCAILAGGPSLRNQDISAIGCSGIRIITINDSWQLRPYADALYFGDSAWWRRQIDTNPGQPIRFHDWIYKGFWVKGGYGFHEHPQVHQIEFSGQVGLETKPDRLRHGSNSGYAAINLAYLYGAKKIVLLGYDMKCNGQRTHWHDGHHEDANRFEENLKLSMLPMFDHLVEPLKEAGVQVINATPDSDLKCWPYMPLEEALKDEIDQ